MTTLPRVVCDEHEGVVATVHVPSEGAAFVPNLTVIGGAYEPLIGVWMGRAKVFRTFLVDEVDPSTGLSPWVAMSDDAFVILFCDHGGHNVKVSLTDLREAAERFRQGEKRIKVHTQGSVVLDEANR